MTESNREHLSTLMDGELERDAREFVLRRLSNDDELSARWRRYHLVRACLQRELSSAADLTGCVSEAITTEPGLASASAASRWLKPLSGAAIAASVAVVALVGINSSLLERGQPELLAEQPGFVSQPTPFDWSFSQPLVPVSFSEATAADRQRISGYLMRHNQAAGSVGFVSYVPIVVGTRTPPAVSDGEGVIDSVAAER